MSEWISVYDRLPERLKEVLCYFEDDARIDISWIHSYTQFMYEDIFGKVTHWMPLPDPPKEN